MIFDIAPEQIKSLDPKNLVELLKKLLYAEAQYSGISLRGISVPLQISIPDGGEDARISWTGGHEQTDYLPSRFCIFQSKATDPGPAGWKKEVWTKDSQKNNVSRKLNEAVTKAITENGSYVGFTSEILIGSKYDRRVEAIIKGIQDAGGDPSQLSVVDIYDANKIADWVKKHPAIAIWINENQSGLVLRSFLTIKELCKKTDISSIEQIEDKTDRFLIRNKNTSDQSERGSSNQNSLPFEKVRERITDHLADSGRSVRIIGPSGVGKTRFIYEVFRDETTTAKMSLATSAIYCDFREIGSQVFEITRSLSNSGKSSLIIVDECPRETATKLCEIVITKGSKLRLLTIGNDNQIIKNDSCLNISVGPADDSLIKGIIQQRYPTADYSDINIIINLSGGYPRIAVLATDNYIEGSPILKSVEDVVERILTGCGINRAEEIRAIECLALFQQLGTDERLSDEIDVVAENFARQTGDEMYEHLVRASKHHLVDRRGCLFIAQPLPIAIFLGVRRLDFLRVKTVLNFIESDSTPLMLKLSFLNQWRYFDSSKTAASVAERLLESDGLCGSLEQLNTALGSQCLNAIVHIDPDGVADIIKHVYGDLSTDDLDRKIMVNHNLTQVLGILVFRKESFHIAANLLMKLAAIDNTSYAKSLKGQFKQLFQLRLSGTEAEPFDRFKILDQGVSSGCDKIRSICIEALENTLKRNYFSKIVSYDQIGTRAPLKDWEPTIWGEVFEFHRCGLQRLDNIRSTYKQYATRCEEIISIHIRELICENLYSDIEKLLIKIKNEKGIWLAAINGIGNWLYFDRTDAADDLSQKIRSLYDDLLPTDLIQKALIYTKFWSSNIRNPDLIYEKEDQSTKDYEYSSRKAVEVAVEISVNPELVQKALQHMVPEELNNVLPFAHELVMRVENPVQVFQDAVNIFEKSDNRKGIQFLRGLLAGIDKMGKELSNKCIQIASESNALKDQMINIYTAVNISIDRVNEIVQGLQNKSIPAKECVYLSYGKGLNNLNPENIFPLIDELSSNQGIEGIWTALEIINMYQLDREKLVPQLATRIKQLTTSKRLLEDSSMGTRDGYQLEQLILLIQKDFGIDDDFAVLLGNQVVRLCQVEDYRIFLDLDSSFKNIIKIMTEEKPFLLWKTLSRFFEIATPSEAHHLESLIGAPKHNFDGTSHNTEGILFNIENHEHLNWAKVNPETRAPFLCMFYPIFDGEIDSLKWHPALENLTHEFGAVEKFRQALARRFHPSSWSGSIIPHLEMYFKPLEQWFKHPIPEMSSWAREMHRSLEQQIAWERKRE